MHVPPVLPLSSLHTASPLNILPWKNPLRRYRPSPTPHAKNTLPRPPFHPPTHTPPTSAAATPPNCLRLAFNTSSLSLKLVHAMCLTHFGDFLPHYITASSCLTDKRPPEFPSPPSQIKRKQPLSPATASLWAEPADQPVRSVGRLTHEFSEESTENFPDVGGPNEIGNKDEKKTIKNKYGPIISVLKVQHTVRRSLFSFAASCVKASPNTAGWSGASNVWVVLRVGMNNLVSGHHGLLFKAV